ncbi:MAG: thioredoxin family protein [Acidobacteriota bacterium]
MLRSHLQLPVRKAAFLLLFAAGSLAASGVTAQQVRTAERSVSFKPIGLYQLELDGVIDNEARIYHSAGLGTILVRSPQISRIVELVPRGRQMQAFADKSFFRNVDGTYEKLPNEEPIELGTFQLNGDLASFTVEGRRVAFVKKPHLLGPRDREGLIEHSPAYGERSKIYQPIAQYVDLLKRVEDEVEIRVFFGSWCSVCTEFVPHILATEAALAGTKVKFTYHGLPQNFDDAEAKKLGVTSVPTGIIFQNGEEVGRASGYSWQYPSMTVVNTLSGLKR